MEVIKKVHPSLTVILLVFDPLWNKEEQVKSINIQPSIRASGKKGDSRQIKELGDKRLWYERVAWMSFYCTFLSYFLDFLKSAILLMFAYCYPQQIGSNTDMLCPVVSIYFVADKFSELFT